MISNEAMKENRFGRWATARRLYRKIEETLAADGIVVVATYTQAMEYHKKHLPLFKATKTGVYVQRGKRWECIDGCGFRFFRPKQAA